VICQPSACGADLDDSLKKGFRIIVSAHQGHEGGIIGGVRGRDGGEVRGEDKSRTELSGSDKFG